MNRAGEKSAAGFTLIELMIVVAIIAILVAIALPAYMAYVTHAQAVAGLDEIRGGKSGFEVAITEGQAASVDPVYIGLASASKRCSTISASADAGGAGTIQCTLAGNTEVVGKNISLTRSSSGFWTCDASELPEKFRPEGCG